MSNIDPTQGLGECGTCSNAWDCLGRVATAEQLRNNAREAADQYAAEAQANPANADLARQRDRFAAISEVRSDAYTSLLNDSVRLQGACPGPNQRGDCQRPDVVEERQHKLGVRIVAGVLAALTVVAAAAIIKTNKGPGRGANSTATLAPSQLPSPTSDPSVVRLCFDNDGLAKLTMADCETLPILSNQLPSVTEWPVGMADGIEECITEDRPLPKLIGVVGRTPAEDHLDGLPAKYRQALEAALQDPAISYLNRNKTQNTLIFGTLAGNEGAVSADLPGDATDFQIMCLTTGIKPKLIPTQGGVKVALFHEGWHSMEADWSDDGHAMPASVRRANQADLQRYAELCNLETQESLERFRAQHGPEALALLTKLSASYTGAQAKEVRATVAYLRKAFATPNGLEELAVYSEGPLDCQANIGAQLLYTASAHIGRTILKLDQGQDLTPLKDLNKLHIAFAEADYAHIDESGNLQGIIPEAGHGYDSVRERRTSLATSLHFNPNGVLRNLIGLPTAERQWRAHYELTLFYGLVARNDPGLLPHLNLDYVLHTFTTYLNTGKVPERLWRFTSDN